MYILLYNQLEAKIKSSIFGTPITLRYEQILHWWIEEYVWNWLTKSLSSTVEFLGRNWELKSWWRILFQFFGQQKKLYLFILVFDERNFIKDGPNIVWASQKVPKPENGYCFVHLFFGFWNIKVHSKKITDFGFWKDQS